MYSPHATVAVYRHVRCAEDDGSSAAAGWVANADDAAAAPGFFFIVSRHDDNLVVAALYVPLFTATTRGSATKCALCYTRKMCLVARNNQPGPKEDESFRWPIVFEFSASSRARMCCVYRRSLLLSAFHDNTRFTMRWLRIRH